jgi:hypothetical protein
MILDQRMINNKHLKKFMISYHRKFQLQLALMIININDIFRYSEITYETMKIINEIFQNIKLCIQMFKCLNV